MIKRKSHAIDSVLGWGGGGFNFLSTQHHKRDCVVFYLRETSN